MFSREERILSEILVSRGLVERERIEACAKALRISPRGGSLVDALIESGTVDRDQAEAAAEEARTLDEALEPELPPGKRLGEFRLLREIGRGGMGIVYEAEQESLGRRVALKVLPAGAALDERLAVRFLREARAAGRLRHPGIVPVYTSGRTEGVLYFAMELIEGRSLAEAIAEGPLLPSQAARIATQVARALEFAHAAGLVHRDIKPENILISTDGRAHIADFGLVHETSGALFTLSRHILGTPAFIAPEQARGESVDPRGDIYGLGGVLYAMLAGVPPYSGEVPSLVLSRVLAEDPPSILSLCPDLSPALAAICARAMARERDNRYPSAVAMAEDLDRFLETGSALAEQGGSPTASPESKPDPGHASATPPESKPVTSFAAPAPVGLKTGPGIADSVWAGSKARLALAIAALLAGGAILAIVFSPRNPVATTPTGPAPASAAIPVPAELQLAFETPGQKTSPTAMPDGRLAYASNAAGHWGIYMQANPEGQFLNLTAGSPVDHFFPAISPDGHFLVTRSRRNGGGIYLMELPSGKMQQLIERVATGFAWSSDGREIVFTDSLSEFPGMSGALSKLWAVEISTRRCRPLTGMYAAQARSSPVSKRIVFVSQGGAQTDIWTIPESGGDAVRITDDAALEWSPLWSADGTRLYFGSDRGGSGGLFRISVDSASGRPLGEAIRVGTAVFPAPFYLADGRGQDRSLVAISLKTDGRLHRLTLDPARPTSVIRTNALIERFLAADSPQPSPDGRRLAYTAVTSQEDLAIDAPDGSQPRLLTQDAFHDRVPRWSPDGSRIAFQSDRSGHMEIWTIRPDGSDLRRLTLTQANATLPVWSPDGTQIAYTVEGQGAFVVRVDGDGADRPFPGGAPAAIPGPADSGGTFEPSSWSPDGKTLAGTAKGIVLYSLGDSRYRRLTDRGTRPVWLDDRRLLYTEAREIRLLDTRKGDSQVLFSSAPGGLSPNLGVSAGGTEIYVSLTASSQEIWRIDVKE